MAAVGLMGLLCIGGLASYNAATQPRGDGTPNTTHLPSGGITIEKAIDIATRTSAANGDVSAAASPGYDERLGRWVWRVHWAYSAGPTSGEFCDIWVDMYTGEILDRECVFS